MYFKLCQRCERFFYSDAEYKAHSCFQNEKKRIPSPAASSVAEEEKATVVQAKPAAENQDSSAYMKQRREPELPEW